MLQHHEFARSRSGLIVPRARPIARLDSPLSRKERRALQREKLWAGGSQQALLMISGGATNATAALIYAAGLSGGCYWEFNENSASTTFVDQFAHYDMTARETGGTAATSSVTTSTGVIESRAFLANLTEGRTAYIPAASSFKLPNSDWMFGGWFRNTTAAAGSGRWVMGNPGSSGTDRQALIYINATNSDLQFAVSNDGTALTNIDTNFVATSGTYALIIASLDRAGDSISVRWRNTSAGSMSSASTAFSSALYTGSVPNFNVNDGLSGDNTYFSGTRAGVVAADLCFYFPLACTDAIFDYLFNSGNGKTKAQIQSDAGY